MDDDNDKPKTAPEKKRNAGWFVAGDPRRATNGARKKSKTGKTLTQLAREHTEEILEFLIDTMRDDNVNRKVRVEAGSLLLSRGWGSPTQQIQIDANVSHNTVATVDASLLTFEDRERILMAFNNSITATTEARVIEHQPINEGDDESY
jgi:hypothetical protein